MYKVYNQRIAGKLMAMGFVLKGLSKNEQDSSKNVFLFKESDELKEAIKQLTNK